MRSYTSQHRHCCGMNPRARTSDVVITDQAGQVLVSRNAKTNPGEWPRLIEPCRSDLVVAVECIFMRFASVQDFASCSRLGKVRGASLDNCLVQGL